MDDVEKPQAEGSRTIGEMIRDLLRATGRRREQEADALYGRVIAQFGLDEEETAALVDSIERKG